MHKKKTTTTAAAKTPSYDATKTRSLVLEKLAVYLTTENPLAPEEEKNILTVNFASGPLRIHRYAVFGSLDLECCKAIINKWETSDRARDINRTTAISFSIWIHAGNQTVVDSASFKHESVYTIVALCSMAANVIEDGFPKEDAQIELSSSSRPPASPKWHAKKWIHLVDRIPVATANTLDTTIIDYAARFAAHFHRNGLDIARNSRSSARLLVLLQRFASTNGIEETLKLYNSFDWKLSEFAHKEYTKIKLSQRLDIYEVVDRREDIQILNPYLYHWAYHIEPMYRASLNAGGVIYQLSSIGMDSNHIQVKNGLDHRRVLEEIAASRFASMDPLPSALATVEHVMLHSLPEPDFTMTAFDETGQEHSYKIHSWLVAAVWPYIGRLIKSGMEESKTGVAKFPPRKVVTDMDAVRLGAILTCAYGGFWPSFVSTNDLFREQFDLEDFAFAPRDADGVQHCK